MSYPSQGSEIDNDFHPVDSGLEATNDHWGTKLAGDVVPIGVSGGAGQSTEAPSYVTGNKTDPKVISIGNQTARDWVSRTKSRLK
jgi:hypothetical protein